MSARKIVTIHQPNYLPYLGFFYKMREADEFIIYDSAQFVKGRIDNRQRIRTNQGWTWLTIPVKHYLLPFNKAEISHDSTSNKLSWNEKHWTVIESSYKKTPHFQKYEAQLRTLFLRSKQTTLAEWDTPFIEFLKTAFGLKHTLSLFSSLDIPDNEGQSEKLAIATEKLGGTIYLSGPSGKKYLDYAPFEKRGIEVQFTQFHHPEYQQYHSRFDNKFEPNMAALDALFNIGALPD